MKRPLKLAEVCKQLDLPPYVLRYWETEFPALQKKGGGGRSGSSRTYDEAELGVLRRIKQLLYDEGYTIAGARKKLESEPPPPTGESGKLFAEGKEKKKGAAKPKRATRRRKQASEPESLDSTTDERIETLRRGVAEALREAREILSLLERPSE